MLWWATPAYGESGFKMKRLWPSRKSFPLLCPPQPEGRSLDAMPWENVLSLRNRGDSGKRLFQPSGPFPPTARGFRVRGRLFFATEPFPPAGAFPAGRRELRNAPQRAFSPDAGASLRAGCGSHPRRRVLSSAEPGRARDKPPRPPSRRMAHGRWKPSAPSAACPRRSGDGMGKLPGGARDGS